MNDVGLMLERQKVGVSATARRAEFNTEDGRDRLMRFLILRLDADLLTQKLVGDTKVAEATLHFPLSPWQFFKERHAGAWWLRWLVSWRPVKYQTHSVSQPVTFERYATYPHSTYAPPKTFGEPVIVERYT